MPDVRQIVVAKEFTPTPAGRLRSDGPFSGQRFREDVLAPALKSGGVIELNLDGMVSLPSSFWEESTGGLVRAGFTADELENRMQIVTTDPLLAIFIDMARKFISDAATNTIH